MNNKFETIRKLQRACPEWINVLKVYILGGNCKARIYDALGNYLTSNITRDNVKNFIWLAKLCEHITFEIETHKFRIGDVYLDIDLDSVNILDVLAKALEVNARVKDFDKEYYICHIDNLKWFCRKKVSDDLILGALLPYYHEPVEYEWFRNIIKKGGVFVDVGANVGGYTVRASKIAEVYAIEPEKNTFLILKKNMELNNFEGELFNCAVGESEEFATLWGKREYGGDFSISNKTKNKIEIDRVKLVPLDDITSDISSIQLLKIDVEGFEFEVLKGSKETLNKTKNIIIEMRKKTKNNCHHILKQSGFSLVKVCKHNEWPDKPFNALYKR